MIVRRPHRLAALVLVLSVLGFSSHLRAQEPVSFLRQLEAEEQLGRVTLEAERLELQPFTLEWGGWYRFNYFWFEEPGFGPIPSNDRNLRTHDVRLWFSANLEDIHYVYSRFRLTLADFSKGDSFDANDDDTEGVNLDLAFYQLNLTRALQKYCGRDLPLTVLASYGRQYYSVGTGLVYSQIGDGARLYFDAPQWTAELFLADSIRSHDDIDRSIPQRDDSRRFFAGGQFTWTGIDGHEPYAFVLLQRSHHRDKSPFQDYRYDSNYFGIGSHGQLFLPNLRYYAEAIWETGNSSATFVPTQSEDIDAFAVNAGLDYYFNCPGRPRLGVQYALGSGDKDRRSPTNTLFGNLPGTDDDGFLGFGYIDTGYALAAQLANLQFVRIGGAVRPFEDVESFGLNRLEVGSNFFWLWKDERTGGISDVRANLADSDIGNELDVFLHWYLMSDLIVSVRFGTFYPGDAYSKDPNRSFLTTAVTFLF